MSVSVSQIVEKFPQLLSLSRGDGKALISGLKAPQNANRDSLVFAGTAKHLKETLDSPSRHWVVTKDLLPQVPVDIETVIVAANTQLAMAQVAKTFFAQTDHFQVIDGAHLHPKAVISPSAKLGKDCIVGPGAIIGDACELGDGCIIGANAVLEPRVKIGARTHIHPLVFIGHDCELGMDCEVKPNTCIGGEGFGYAQDAQFNHYRLTHYGRVILEDRVHVGAGVQIDRGTFLDSRIGAGTKIDNHCHFGHNIQIGKNTLITGGMIAAGSATLGSYCVFGGRATVAGHLTVADKTQFGGISMIHTSVTEPGEYAGFPLQPLKQALRVRAAQKSLPDLLKQMKRVLKHLGLDSES